jgi:hypothetical protein
VNHCKPRVQTLVVSRYPAPAPVDDFVLLFLPPCGPHLTPLATGSLEPGLLVSPLLGGPVRHRPFTPTLHLHQRKSSCNLHLQYSAKSQSTLRCQLLITARSDHPPVLGRSGPHLSISILRAPADSYQPASFFPHNPVGECGWLRRSWQDHAEGSTYACRCCRLACRHLQTSLLTWITQGESELSTPTGTDGEELKLQQGLCKRGELESMYLGIFFI